MKEKEGAHTNNHYLFNQIGGLIEERGTEEAHHLNVCGTEEEPAN